MIRNRTERLAFFISTLNCGGAERAVAKLVRGVVQLGIPVDLLLARAEGPFLTEIPSAVRIIEFGVRKLQHSIPGIARYLPRERPHGVVSHITQANVALLIARLLARVNTPVAIVEQNNLSACVVSGEVRPYVARMARWLYPMANEIVGVSAGVAQDVEQCLGLKPGRVRPIFNPIVDAQLLKQAAEPSHHEWLGKDERPVLLAVGRLAPQKDYPTLLHAFALVRKVRPAKLIILGEGSERGHLESLRRELGLDADVDLPGVSSNPFAAMREASLFVLSSRFEGLPTVLIEALACGCPAVSTDCPNGPAEILDDGRFGLLAPVGNPQALAAVVLNGLNRTWDRQILRTRGEEYSVRSSVSQYLEVLSYPLSASLTGASMLAAA